MDQLVAEILVEQLLPVRIESWVGQRQRRNENKCDWIATEDFTLRISIILVGPLSDARLFDVRFMTRHEHCHDFKYIVSVVRCVRLWCVVRPRLEEHRMKR